MNVLLWLAVVFIIHSTSTFLKGFQRNTQETQSNGILRPDHEIQQSTMLLIMHFHYQFGPDRRGLGSLGTADREDLDLFHSKRPRDRESLKPKWHETCRKVLNQQKEANLTEYPAWICIQP